MMMLLAIGPGVIIPAGLAALFGIGGLLQGFRSARERREITESGELLGTGEPLGGLVPEGMEQLLQEGGEYSPRVRVAPLQWEEDERVRGVHRGFADAITHLMEKSRLGGLAEDVGGMRESFQDFLSGEGEGADPYSQRVARYDTAAEDIGGRIRALNEDVQTRLRATADDPTIITDEEMDAIIGRSMARNRQVAESRGAMAEETAARRGLGPGQVAALTEEIAGTQRLADLEQAASVAEINAARRAELGQRATEALGTIGGELGSREAAVFGALGGLSDQYVQALPGLVGLEGELGRTYEDRIVGALANRASIEQPRNLAMIGDLLEETGRFNALLRAGASGDLASMMTGISTGAMSFLDSRLQAQAMEDYAASMAGPSGADLGGGFGGLLGGGLGLLLGGPVGGMVGLGMGQAGGGTVGSLFD